MEEESNQLKAMLREVLPKSGLVYSERGGLTETLCKPKIMPLKSAVLEQLERLEQASLEEELNEQGGDGQEERANEEKEQRK